MRVIGLDHVQVAMPAHRETEARAFYAGLLGMTEIEKPAHLAVRGGLWFAAGDRQLHLGVEAEFTPARKAHPAPNVSGRYFAPNAPLLCRKRIPALSETSVSRTAGAFAANSAAGALRRVRRVT